MAIPTHGKFDILINFGENKNGTVDGGEPNAASPQQENASPKDPKKGDNKTAVWLTGAVQVSMTLGRQALNSAVANIGITTGNFYAQNQVQKAVSATETVIGLAVAAKNPITFAIAVGGMAISAISEQKQQDIQREIANYTSAQYARRIGYSIDRR